MSSSHVKVLVPPTLVAPRGAQLAATLAAPLFQAVAWLSHTAFTLEKAVPQVELFGKPAMAR